MSDDDSDARRPDGRFRPGHCGNPKGRPKKTTISLVEILQKVLDEPITVGSRRMPVAEALVRTSIKQASSNPKAALQLLKMLNSLAPEPSRAETVASADDQDTVEAFLDEQRRRAAAVSPASEGDDDDREQD